MIPVSLLLILVAVTLLVLGLTGGSSSLLIGSIVASLVAAVALVIGARQSADARGAAETPDPAAPDLAPPGDPAEVFVAEPEFAAAAERSARGDRDDFSSFDAAFAADSPDSPAHRPATADTVVTGSAAADERGDLSADEVASASPEADPLADQAAAEPDYDRAASVINAARSTEPGDTSTADDEVAEPDEFAEPDADDPEDEPLPQSVRPADAVRVARLDAEVLVVDGRPRYHVPDCRSLVGRLTEPIPVNEAVELGFSPCGLCRPVDRLVGAAVRH